MLLADTSILIAHFRNPTAARATLITSELATVPGIVVTEFRAGGRTHAQVPNCFNRVAGSWNSSNAATAGRRTLEMA